MAVFAPISLMQSKSKIHRYALHDVCFVSWHTSTEVVNSWDWSVVACLIELRMHTILHDTKC